MGRTGQTLLCAALAGAALSLPAGASAKAPPVFFGASAVGEPSPTLLQRASAGGVRTLRLQFNWGVVEPTRGARDWETIDRLVTNAAASGMQILPVLLGVPQWVSSNPATPPIYHPQSRSDWANFLVDVTRRYGPNGAFWALHPELPPAPIRNWQVWNEVNFSFFWGGPPNARDYVDLLQLTREGLHAGDPTAKIIMAGLIPFRSAARGTIDGEVYLRRLFKVRGFRGLIDALAIHPLGQGPGVTLTALLRVRELLNTIGGRRVPLWATEFGWSTGGQGWSTSPFRATPETQAQRVSRVYRLLAKNRKRLKLRRALYFSLMDFDQFNMEDDWTARMGLFDLNGQPKPAWFAYARAAGGTP